MSELRASVVMDLRGNLERQSRRYEGAMRTMANNGQRHMTRLQRVTSGVGRTLDRVGNRWMALATGAAGFGTVRNLVNLEERFTRLGIQSQKSAEEMEELRRQIFDTAREPDIRVDPSQITGAIEAIVEKTGDLEFARENIRNIAMAISATGAEGGNIGEILAEFQKMDIRGMDAVLQSIDTLNEQGKAGAFTLQNLASLGPRVVTAYTALGRQGPEAIREMGAALQVIRQGTGSSEQAATAFEALLRTFQDAEKAKELARKSGVQIFDPEELARGREILRPINELIVEIVEAAEGRTSRLSEIFDAEAMRSFNAALGEYNRTGTVESMDRFFQVQGDGTTTMGDSARAAETAAGSVRNLSSAWQDFADTNLSEYIQDAADALNSLDQATVDRWLKIAGITAGGVAGLYALRSLGRLGADLGRGAGVLRNRSTSGGISGGLGAASSMTPVPVFVTNLGGLGGGGSSGRNGGMRKGGGFTPPTSRTGGSPSAPPSASRPTLSSRALSAASRVSNGSAVAVGRSLPAVSTVLAAQGIGGLIEDAVERTETGGRVGNYVELARETAKQAVMEYGRSSVNTFREAGESVLRIFVDQDGRVKDARAERGQGGPEIDVDLGNWGTWP
ncbi:phage tail tape measure protein [Vreelandella maris]|uniref:Phage tail tape measure protein n=1 Tax=Vreelandella maris TaxID=2729617 RepID=A0A7Y6V8W8_9GAMM|nr:phage tail tape measure protein [Halomonas maris]NVF15013.1 phage tail tape measure protein [Halomonas maris]